MPPAKEVQDEILAVMRDLHPHTQTHSEMATQLEALADPCQVALNMDAMAKDGRLELIREGWDFNSYTKRYRLAGRVFTAS